MPDTGPLTPAFAQNFWGGLHKDDSGCWLWVKKRSGVVSDTYGTLSVNGKSAFAHRIAYQLANGSIPKGLHICHHCDNPPCCNPEHLFAGTASENMQDKERKGRGRGGKKSGNTWHPSLDIPINARPACEEINQFLWQVSSYMAGKYSREEYDDDCLIRLGVTICEDPWFIKKLQSGKDISVCVLDRAREVMGVARHATAYPTFQSVEKKRAEIAARKT